MKKTILYILLIIFLTGCGDSSFNKLKSAMNNPDEFAKLLNEIENPNTTDKHGRTILSETVYANNLKAIEILLNKGADPLIADNTGWNTLDYAAYKDSIDSLKLIHSKRSELFSFDNKNDKLIYKAIENFRTDLLKFYIEIGLPMDYRFATTKSLLRKAVEYDQENNDVIVMLLENGADPNSPETDGKTPLFFMNHCRNKNIIAAFVKHGANLNHLDNAGHSAAFYYSASKSITMVLYMMQFGHIPNEEYFVIDDYKISYETDTTEYKYRDGVYTSGFSRQLVKNTATTTETFSDSKKIPLLEYADKKYPKIGKALRKAGYGK